MSIASVALLKPKFKAICDCRQRNFSQPIVQHKQSRKNFSESQVGSSLNNNNNNINSKSPFRSSYKVLCFLSLALIASNRNRSRVLYPKLYFDNLIRYCSKPLFKTHLYVFVFLKKFFKIVERDRAGECPMYRGKFWQRERREMERVETRNRWYEKGGYETVMFVDATPNGELAAECKKVLKSSELKIRVVEGSGQSVS